MLVLFFIVLSISSFGQLKSYSFEEKGYIANIFETPYGLVITGNLANDIFLYQNGNLIKILSSPGCGRYNTISYDGRYIGFKLIHNDGKQQPCLYDLSNKKIVYLHSSVDNAGQPVFDKNNNVYFTIDNRLYVKSADSTYVLNELPCYVNYYRVSSDGKYIAFSIDDKGIVLYDLSTGKYEIISPPACNYPQFSYDDRYIAYGTSPGLLYVYDIYTGKTFGGIWVSSFKWHPYKHKILAISTIIKDFEIINSDVCEISVPEMNITYLTKTSKYYESSCNYNKNGDIIYSFLNVYDIYKIKSKSKSIKIANLPKLLQSYVYPEFNTKADVTVSGTVPYVHQVYDTPSWHAGWGSCAPTTAIMAIAYYNRLPKWPTSVNHGYSWDPHISNYGSYVADKYRFNEWYYQESADAYGTTAYGGYGYMWTGNYSPNSRMKNYIQNHYLTSNQYWTTSCTFNATKTEIDNGYVHPICSYLTSAGHLVLAIGYKSNQYTLIFNDPYGNKNTPGYPSYDGAYVYYDWPGYNYGYQNLDNDGSHSCVAWTVAARGTQPVYSDTVIDDNHFEHGFYMNNSANGSHMRYFRDFNVGYGGHCWYTITEASGSDICYCKWTPNIHQNGYYKISAFIPPKGSNTTSAKYKIFHSNGVDSVIINQNANRNQWVDLGTYYLTTSSQKYVYLGDVTGHSGDSIAFDCIKFSLTQVDNVPPTTTILVPTGWQTQDFIANFIDSDNYGIEKAFYQVLYYDGTYWTANAQRGFFGDNFDTLQPYWNIYNGTWTTQNGSLIQSDESISNTNIYAYLNQTLSNRYLYNFKVKITGTGTNKRFGFHFFSDSANFDNRSNSYFIWFRQNTSSLEFYKVVNNTFTTYQHIVNNVVTNDNQWYDIVVTYDRTTGEIKVWRDGVFLGSWTDPSPLPMNSGKYISFRTGNCSIYVNELKVYRSRYPQVTITLGGANKDICYQNPNPTTYAAKIKSIVVDVNNNLSAIAYSNLNVDWTPPTVQYVIDGTGTDIDTVSTNQNLNFEFSFVDPNSGISEYYYAIGTSPNDSNIVNWTSCGNSNVVVINNLNLIPGVTYYFSVKAVNNAGLVSMPASSDGFVFVPQNLPVADFYAMDTILFLPNAYAIFVNTSQNALSCLWDFGDGNTSTQYSPYHLYTDTGTYTVSLTVYGNYSLSNTLTKVNYIQVKQPSELNTNNFSKIELYPVPCDEYLLVTVNESEVKSYEILNSRGEIIINGELIPNKSILINTSKFAQGLYTLHLKGTMFTKKFIIKH
jgi:PKD repeat protein